MQIIEVFGRASGRTTIISYTLEELSLNLLKWLRLKGITVGSSCDGEGICKKCIIQNDWMTCQLSLRSFLEFEPSGKIIIDYL